MLTTVEGTYHNGRITLLETPDSPLDGRVLVTFLSGRTGELVHRQMRFGQFGGSPLPDEEDFRVAEWHGEQEFDDLNVDPDEVRS